ncbi:MAG: hypothetical protein QME52_06665 [Bacteroidota bacterium]|nr:hypothetical protein [Bacteroidota bacterium]
MGQQQLILIIIGVLIVTIAIAVSIGLFSAHHAEANKDNITGSLGTIAADAYQYKIRPRILGGGRPSYEEYKIPTKFKKDDNGDYDLEKEATENQVVIKGSSSINKKWFAICTVDSIGKTQFGYNGWN